MRSEDKASGKNAQNDISADELLKLLHKSIDASDKKDADGNKNVKKSRSSMKTEKTSLKIDDDVYNTAKEELHNSDAANATDESDLDIDTLIAKYISRPEKKTAEVVRDSELEETEGTQNTDDEWDTGEAFLDSSDGDAVFFESDVSDPVMTEPEFEPTTVFAPDDADELFIPQPPADEAYAEAEAYEDDSDMKLAELIPEDEPGTDLMVYENPEPDMDSRTAVFDVTKIREASDSVELTEEENDEAFAASETEVFTPVHEAADQVYGTPDVEEIDQTDLDLMIAFGMNEELKDAVGEEKATEMEDFIQRKHEATEQLEAVKNRVEFTSRDQVTEILTSYKSKYYTLVMRIALAAVLLLTVFLVEDYRMFGLELPSFMKPTSFPVVYAMIDLQFIVLAGALVYRQVIDGVKNLVTLKPTPESITAFMLIMSVLYTIVACMSAPVEGYALYNLPTAFAVLLALIYEFLNLKRDIFSFNVICGKRKKFVVTPVSEETESLEREMFKEYVPADSQIIRVCKTDFVDGFFARIEGARTPKPIIGIMIPVVLILAMAFIILSYLRDQSVYQAFTMAFIAISVIMPISSFLIYSLPFYRASKDAYDRDSAIIGERSLEDYSTSSVISFEDKEVFPSGGVKVTSIKVFGNNRIDEIIYNLASAFIKVGGPLAEVFSQATYELGHSENVELVEVDDDGFTVTIDDAQVYIGKASYMEKKDYDPPYDAEDQRIETSASVGILYVAYQGQLRAKVYVQYTIDNEFENILSQLYKTGMCVGIRSFDPNIDDLLLAKKIRAMKYPVKVIRSKTVEDIPHTYERCESGIVSKRSVKDLLRTVTLCERVSANIKSNLIFKVLAMLIGIVVMVFLYSFGASFTLYSLWLMLYQLIWLIPVGIVSFFTV